MDSATPNMDVTNLRLRLKWGGKRHPPCPTTAPTAKRQMSEMRQLYEYVDKIVG